jgi:hypothetical protein
MVLSLYYGIESEYEIKTALGVGSVTTPSLFS